MSPQTGMQDAGIGAFDSNVAMYGSNFDRMSARSAPLSGSAGPSKQRAEIRKPIGSTTGFRRVALAPSDRFSQAAGRVGAHRIGCPETELLVRLRQANRGAQLVFESTFVVHHHISGARLTWRHRLPAATTNVTPSLIENLQHIRPGIALTTAGSGVSA